MYFWFLGMKTGRFYAKTLKLSYLLLFSTECMGLICWSKCCMPLIFSCSSGTSLDFFVFLERLGSGEAGTVVYLDLYSFEPTSE